MNRLQLLVEVLQRVHRMLKEEDQKGNAEAFTPFILGHSGQYVYHLKGQDTSEHLQKIGELMQRLLAELQSGVWPGAGVRHAGTGVWRAFSGGRDSREDKSGERIERQQFAIARTIWKRLTGKKATSPTRAMWPI